MVAAQHHSFGIDWLRDGVLVGKDTVIAPNADEAIVLARIREARVRSARRREHRPNRFRLSDASGKILGSFQIVHVDPFEM
jgi:hypothetical protein